MLRQRGSVEVAEVADVVATGLLNRGFSIVANAVPADLVRALEEEVDVRWDEDQFRPARIGSGENQHLSPRIRSDRIHWIEESHASRAQREYLAILDELRRAVNRATFLGLEEWEGHLAVYPPGARYRKHLDVFANARERLVSTILYLNQSWAPGDGGELRIWTEAGTPDGPTLDVQPRAGTMVTFLSEDFFHEVLPSKTHRKSLTGWFRTRPLGVI